MKLNRRMAILAALAGGISARAGGQTPPPEGDEGLPGGVVDPRETIDLWPGGAPGRPEPAPVETVDERSRDAGLADRAVSGISRPRLVVFRPRQPNGAAMLVMPGGGYSRIVIDKEGYEMGRWLSARGTTVFVLFYRLPGEGWANRSDTPLADAQRALRLIRYSAASYGLDPARVGVMGFSAGGHVCADLAARFDRAVYVPVDAADRLSARPWLAAPIYPVVSMTLPVAHAGSREQLLGPDPTPAEERAHSPQHNVPDNAPPHFLLHAEDDGAVPVANSLELHSALRSKGIAVEMHLFANGGHGFGLSKTQGKPVEVWPDLFLNWAATQGFP